MMILMISFMVKMMILNLNKNPPLNNNMYLLLEADIKVMVAFLTIEGFLLFQQHNLI